VLPKRQFVLIGPGRWGSRGDIKLGVPVTYSDINNTAVLIEVAVKKGKYVPDLSFGTHFFQDLVEANIRYLPLYPDDDGIIFNRTFLHASENALSRLCPEYAGLSDTVRLIDVPQATGGQILRVLFNADLDEAVAIIASQSTDIGRDEFKPSAGERRREDYGRWRMLMVERLAAHLDPERFGVKALYVFGSTRSSTAGPGSDIDIILHFTGNERQEHQLKFWLEGWSRALAEFNYLRTGYRSEGLLDAHIVTDADIAAGTAYAAKIGAATDPAREVPLGHPVR